ncbi:MAG: 3-dehydroquinate synthase family protein [Gammaproteobacteria bacterium]
MLISASRTNYTVDFVENIEQLLEALANNQNTLTIMDRNIEQLYPQLAENLKTFSKVECFDATEQNKTLQGIESLLRVFQENKANRATTVIAMGGGILQDVVSFAAHIYYRGLSVVLVPTTLLAMCDSSIGGKCGVNFQGYKNQVGAYHPPKQVVIWTGFLASLSLLDLRSGYGEIFKYTLLSYATLYADLKLLFKQKSLINESLIGFIRHGLMTKKKYIEEDEFDTSVRALLNFGHTFGHALELASQYKIPHGIAVAQGIDLANYIAWQKGLLKKELFDDVHLFVKQNFSCEIDGKVTANMLIAHTQQDKKIVASKLKMVLMEDIGKFRMEAFVLDNELEMLVQNYLRL